MSKDLSVISIQPLVPETPLRVWVAQNSILVDIKDGDGYTNLNEIFLLLPKPDLAGEDQNMAAFC